jgi:hypothetical protein
MPQLWLWTFALCFPPSSVYRQNSPFWSVLSLVLTEASIKNQHISQFLSNNIGAMLIAYPNIY